MLRQGHGKGELALLQAAALIFLELSGVIHALGSQELAADPERVQQLCGWRWIQDALQQLPAAR
jgi:hypothetical protein